VISIIYDSDAQQGDQRKVDIKNPAAGGAERVAIETAKRFAKEKVKFVLY